ncbi:MAG: hypothetical protein EOP11_09415 [Proteobacteria bacterium]|nr:MAG: hypothetical protein EOP11_09415 [Pseudomonadota bacterium]
MRTERGSVILEAFLFLFIVAVFFKGAANVNRRLQSRTEAIIRHRNETIAKIREDAAKSFLPSFLPVLGDRGVDSVHQRSRNR